MNSNASVLVALVAVIGASPLRAESTETTSAAPTTPPPVVAPPSTGSQSAASQIVYAAKLPTAQELTNAASAQGFTVEQIADTGAQITATYKRADGQIYVVTYQLLPTAQQGVTQSVVLPTTPPPVVVYRSVPRVVYYYPDYPRYAYYPDRYWVSPISLSLGFGFGYYGGYRGHGGYHGHHGGHFHHR